MIHLCLLFFAFDNFILFTKRNTDTIYNIKPGVSNADTAAEHQSWTASAFLPAVGDRQEEQKLRRNIGGGQAVVAVTDAAAEASPQLMTNQTIQLQHVPKA